jgi:hypothetical protein
MRIQCKSLGKLQTRRCRDERAAIGNATYLVLNEELDTLDGSGGSL